MSEQDPFEAGEPVDSPRKLGGVDQRIGLAPPAADRPAPRHRAADATITGAGVDAMYPLRVLYKRRWLAATALVVVVVVAFVQALSVIPVFEGRVRLLIENERLNLVKFQDVREGDRTSAAYYQTQYMILQSRSLARRTLARLEAEGLTQRSGAVTVEPLTFRNALPKAGKLVVGFFKAPEPLPAASAESLALPTLGKAAASVRPDSLDTVAPEKQPDQSEVDGFLSGLIVTPVPTSRLVDVRYRSTDPLLAARYANAIVREYVEQNMEFKFLATKEATDWLAGRLTDQRQKVQLAEEALQRYREQSGVLSVDMRNDATVQKLDMLVTAVTNARATRIEKEALNNQAQSLQRNPGALETLPAVLSNNYVQQLKAELTAQNSKLAQQLQTLGEQHPEIVTLRDHIRTTELRLQGEIAKVIDSIRANHAAAVAAERSLDQAFNEQKRDALAMNKSGLQMAILQREAEGHRQIYEMLTQRAKETDLTSEIKTNDVRIIDAAEVPRAARGPAPLDGIKFGILWGLVAAIGLAFVVEHLDSRIKTPEELSALLDLPFLGMLPEVPPFDGQGPLLTSEASGHFAESFRALRTNILFSAFEPGARTIVVTSAGVGEGKTSVATNLAASIAHTGQRVLLIDADMRRPRVHSVFGCEQSPGLSELLVGSCKPTDAARSSKIKGLWMMPAGTTPPNPSELLGSSRFAAMIQHVAQRFDWVVLDSPPMMPVTDAAVIAHEVSGVVFVAAADRTTRHAAKAAIAALQRNDARIVGTVLNRVDVIRNPYYYQAAYRKEYAKYYAAASNS